MRIEITKTMVEHKKEAIDKVNALAGDKILVKYPFYLQHNLGRDITSEEAITMFSYIDTIRNIANITKANIDIASNISELKAYLLQYNLLLDGIL
jgi:ERCC4-type nuclease